MHLPLVSLLRHSKQQKIAEQYETTKKNRKFCISTQLIYAAGRCRRGCRKTATRDWVRQKFAKQKQRSLSTTERSDSASLTRLHGLAGDWLARCMQNSTALIFIRQLRKSIYKCNTYCKLTWSNLAKSRIATTNYFWKNDNNDLDSDAFRKAPIAPSQILQCRHSVLPEIGWFAYSKKSTFDTTKPSSPTWTEKIKVKKVYCSIKFLTGNNLKVVAFSLIKWIKIYLFSCVHQKYIEFNRVRWAQCVYDELQRSFF